MPNHYEDPRKKQERALGEYRRSPERRGRLERAERAFTGAPTTPERRPSEFPVQQAAREGLRSGVSRAPQGDIAQRIAGGDGGGQAGVGEVLGGEPGRTDYIPQAQRTPEQQNLAFQQVALQDPRRYAGGAVETPESRLGAFNAAGERIPVTYKRGGSPVDAQGQRRSVFDQLRSMRQLREGDSRARLERAAGADVSLKQPLGRFLDAASKRKFARQRLLAAEKGDIEREAIAGRLGAAGVSAAQKAQATASKQELGERKFALDVAQFEGLQEHRGLERGLARERFGEEAFRGRVGLEQRGAEIREKVASRGQRLGAELRGLEQKYLESGISSSESPEFRREALPRMIETNPQLGELLNESPELRQELLNNPEAFRQLRDELEGRVEE